MNTSRIRTAFLFIFLTFFFAVALLPHPTLAQTTPTPTGFVALAPPPPSSKLGNLYGSQSLSDFVNGLFKFAIALGAIIAVVRLTYAGYLYMGQSDMWSHKGQAKTIIGDVTLGLLILLSIWLILNQINPDITSLRVLQDIKPASQTQSP